MQYSLRSKNTVRRCSFYYDNNVNASRNLVVVANFAGSNNDRYVNLTIFSFRDGARTWNDEALSAIVKTN